jgi:hypothetical protein
MEENHLEEKEILTTEMKDKYIVYNDSTGKTRSYTANNRQGQKFRAVKYYKGNGAINYLGSRYNTRKRSHEDDSSESNRNDKIERELTFVNKTQ